MSDVFIIWVAEPLRSPWVLREATAALKDGRLIQIHATGLQLPPPFDEVELRVFTSSLNFWPQTQTPSNDRPAEVR